VHLPSRRVGFPPSPLPCIVHRSDLLRRRPVSRTVRLVEAPWRSSLRARMDSSTLLVWWSFYDASGGSVGSHPSTTHPLHVLQTRFETVREPGGITCPFAPPPPHVSSSPPIGPILVHAPHSDLFIGGGLLFRYAHWSRVRACALARAAIDAAAVLAFFVLRHRTSTQHGARGRRGVPWIGSHERQRTRQGGCTDANVRRDEGKERGWTDQEHAGR